MDHQFVGKFETSASKWLGYDKYKKFVYGMKYSDDDGNLDIIAQSIFRGNPNVVHFLTFKNLTL